MARASACIGWVCTILMLTAARAEQSLPRQATNEQPATAADALDRQHRDYRPRGSPANRWRYSFHNGHWWYYRDGGRWAYWTGIQWLDYRPSSYRRWYIQQKMTDLDAQLDRYDALIRPYMSDRFGGYIGEGPVLLSEPMSDYGISQPLLDGGGFGSELFYPRPFDGRLNPATSIGGYMGSALRGPFGY